MIEKIIFHIDVNSAYLSWEAVYKIKVLGETIDLREIPSAVGGDKSKRHGIILAKSTPAKKYNIQTGESITDALKKCPDLVLVSPHYDLYEQCSRGFMEILREYSPDIFPYSIDETWLDMTNTQGLFGTPIIAANDIKDRIYRELGFTVNVGVSSNRLLAKMAGDLKKPNMVNTLFPNEIEKMWRLPVSDLFYVGPATTRVLLKLGIRTIGELAKSDVQMLRYHLKSHGELIWSYANGLDVEIPQTNVAANKGYGNSVTIPFDVIDSSTAKMILLSLAETVSSRIRKDNMKAGVIAISIVDFEFKSFSHQMTLLTSTNITKEIHQASCRLFDESWDGAPIRKLGIHTSRAIENNGNRQLSLMDYEKLNDEKLIYNNLDEKKLLYEKYEKVDKAIDSIRNRYGDSSVIRATFLKNRVNHMSGGINKEKNKSSHKEVNYT